jgi:hypothetical protein
MGARIDDSRGKSVALASVLGAAMVLANFSSSFYRAYLFAARDPFVTRQAALVIAAES